MKKLQFFASVPKGMESLLADELRAFGAADVVPTLAGVAFSGPLSIGYRACLWSRIASRVLLSIANFPAESPEALYGAVHAIRWPEHMGLTQTLAVDFNAKNSAITHSQFGGQKVKDAIVDRFRKETGKRPSVDHKNPDLRVNVHLNKDQATLSIDLSGESLHQRGWRSGAGKAPLKENLAAAILQLAEWPEVAKAGGELLDPMCGIGTLPIEAALIAADVAPGLLRKHFGFLGWKGHQPAVWNELLNEARERDQRGRAPLPRIVGTDQDARRIKSCLQHTEQAGLRGMVHFERRKLLDARPTGDKSGIIVVNPPYGERLGQQSELEVLYTRIGDMFKQRFGGWTGYVLTGNSELSKFIGLKATRRFPLFNGPIECRLLRYPLRASVKQVTDTTLRGPVVAFANRLKKNLKGLKKWAKKNAVSCYRIYDADLPEYALQIDRYGEWVHVREYERPREIEEVKAVRRLNDALLALSEVLEVPQRNIFVKQRMRQRGDEQYTKQDQSDDFRIVHENGHKFLVNLVDYMDTGLFLDHRDIRALIGELAQGRDFLNLFAYTGSATVYAAIGGAKSTTTVDMSKTYLAWAKRNLGLNKIGKPIHRIITADCLQWLERERKNYGLIFLDPPTFSNSKSMKKNLEIQRDHVWLIKRCVERLTPDGILIFSNNFKSFKMDHAALPGLTIKEITGPTLPRDFKRTPRIHNAWRISRPSSD